MPAHAPVPGARRPARRRSTSCRTSTPSSSSPPAASARRTCPTPSTRPSTPPTTTAWRRPGCGGRGRHDHHRDVRAPHRVDPVQRGGGADDHDSCNPGAHVKATQPEHGATAAAGRSAASCSAIAAWVVGLIFFAPVLLDGADSLHSEPDAATNPPSFFAPLTLRATRSSSGARRAAARGRRCSTRRPAAILSTVLVLLLAIPAAYALSIRPVQQVDRRDVLLPVHQDAAGRGRPAAALPVRAVACMLDNI